MNLLIVAALFAGLFIYAWLARQISLRGGKVRSDKLGLADLFFGSALACWFGAVIFGEFGKELPRVIQTRDVIQSGSLELLIVMVICGFLRYRGVSLVEFFGLRKVALWKIPWLAFLLLLAAYPLIGAAAGLTQQAGGNEQPQEIVQFFLAASARSDRWSVAIIVAMGAVVAPVAEELIFRGYIHGTFKRYLGMSAGILVNSALFAAIHLNRASLFPLFVLAVCFTLVYEATGSILVSMTMHSLFNMVTFLELATHSPAS